MNGCIYRSQFDLCEKNKEEDEKRGIRRWCDFEGCEDKHPSNADQIRNMTDEELAEMFLTHDEQLYRHCPSDTFAEYCQVKPCVECCDCKACWLDWLRQEAEHGRAD